MAQSSIMAYQFDNTKRDYNFLRRNRLAKLRLENLLWYKTDQMKTLVK